MKIYLSASENSPPQIKKHLRTLINHLSQNHEIFETKITDTNNPPRDQMLTYDIEQNKKRWTAFVEYCDIAIIEATYPSDIEIGYEITQIINMKRPVIIIYLENKEPTYITSNCGNKTIKSSYNKDNLIETIEWCIEEAQQISNSRFTFQIPPKLDDYLIKASQIEGTSKSEYIRELIEKDREYKKIKILKNKPLEN